MKVLSLAYFFSILFELHSTILLYHLQLTQSNQTFTIAFDAPFHKYPTFACFIESGNIQNSQFSLSYDQALTTISNTQITINFITYKSSGFNGESLSVGLLITDEQNSQFSIGVQIVNIASQISFIFPNLTLVQNNASRGIIQIYSLSYPMSYSVNLDLTSTNTLIITIKQSPSSYIANIYFSYIFYTNNYVGQNVAALFKQISQTVYTYYIPYQSFAFTPSTRNVMFAIRQYQSTSIPFFSSQIVFNYNYITGVNPQMMLGYTFIAGAPLTFKSDVFFFNSSFSGCPNSQFLYYLQLYETLPYTCIPCDSSCLQCSTNSTTLTTQTNSNSCISCEWLRYLNASINGNGNCLCLPGLVQVNKICESCQQACLTFNVVYIQTTNTSNFLLTYSQAQVVEQIPLNSNLMVYLNDVQVNFNFNQQQNSYYIIYIALSDMDVCEGSTCQIQFYYKHPELVVTNTLAQSLSMNNATLSIKNFINYYSQVPASLRNAFSILGIVIGISFSGGYSSLVTILFELEQLIDAHRYLKLTLPVIFNELLINMIYFRFLSILNLLPIQYSYALQNWVSPDLDNIGSPKLLYYQNGSNFYKNTITGLISVLGILIINFAIYIILRLIPFKVTKKLAKKISIRKFITIHDTLQQLQLPFFYFALEQIQSILLHPNLVWIYGLAITVAGIIIIFPFLIVIFIYNNRQKKAKIDIYQDLMQDNKMDQKVTYIYYVFNYYRKIMFAMCLLSIFPGLIQIYMLIILNTLHLSFQFYLVAAKTYKSKMKIIIRFINDICIISIEIMILLYNLNDYSKSEMINIGMACLYLALVTTIMGILDVFVKIIDTCQQELRSQHEEQILKAMQKVITIQQFKNEIRCNIGQQLQPLPKDPKQIKFLQDKELMENTFNKDEGSENISIRLQNQQEQAEENDLVFIDEDWVDMYPDTPVTIPKSNASQDHLLDQVVGFNQNDDQFYQTEQSKRVSQTQRRKVKQQQNGKQLYKTEKPIKTKQVRVLHKDTLIINPTTVVFQQTYSENDQNNQIQDFSH